MSPHSETVDGMHEAPTSPATLARESATPSEVSQQDNEYRLLLDSLANAKQGVCVMGCYTCVYAPVGEHTSCNKRTHILYACIQTPVPFVNTHIPSIHTDPLPAPKPEVRSKKSMSIIPRKWLKCDVQGNISMVRVEKHALVHNLGLQARDLRLLEPQVLLGVV